MPNISNINGLVLCDETNVNGVTIANITNIDGLTKSCCVANGPITLGAGATCALACAETHCDEYYSDGNVDACPLVNGDSLYSDAECNCVEDGYYSPNNCDGGCAYCYLVHNCLITVAACPSSCNRIDLVFDEIRCSTACNGEECTSYYVNQEIACPLSLGTAIYTDVGCEECAAAGFYSPKPCEGAELCNYCYTLGGEEGCAITRVDSCGK